MAARKDPAQTPLIFQPPDGGSPRGSRREFDSRCGKENEGDGPLGRTPTERRDYIKCALRAVELGGRLGQCPLGGILFCDYFPNRRES